MGSTVLSDDRRKFIRLAIDKKILVRENKDAVPSKFILRDISASGCFLLGDKYLDEEPENRELYIEFTNPYLHQKFCTNSKIVWVNSNKGKKIPQGLGLHFIDLSEVERSIINEHIQKHFKVINTPVNILIAINDQKVQTSLSSFLNKRDFKICDTTGNGWQAVMKYLDCYPELVLCALDMPSLDGRSILAQLLERNSKVKLIFLTTDEEHSTALMGELDTLGAKGTIKLSEVEHVLVPTILDLFSAKIEEPEEK